MDEQRWEYAQLWLNGAKQHKAGLLGGQEGWSFDCSIVYHSPDGSLVYRILGNRNEIKPQNPFDIAMGRLGGAGWELVSAQYGNTTGIDPWISGSRDTALIEWGRGVACFKRPVVPGRAVDEPKFEV